MPGACCAAALWNSLPASSVPRGALSHFRGMLPSGSRSLSCLGHDAAAGWRAQAVRRHLRATPNYSPRRANTATTAALKPADTPTTMLGRSRAADADIARRLQLVQASAIVPDRAATLARKVFERIKPDAQFVLIGEASHGTHDFYRMRAELTAMLIKERGFNAVAVEADFPDAFRANLYVRGLSKDRNAEEALGDFKRFPTWMWRNTVMVDFIEQLRRHNASIPPDGRRRHGVGFYGMDVYSLHSSAAKVIEYLQKVDPEAADRARARYRCFDRFGADSMAYAYAVGVGGVPSCAEAAVQVLSEVVHRVAQKPDELDGEVGEELGFQAKCNARVVKGAEAYYRNMFFGEEQTWNLRDKHFLGTVQAIEEHLAHRVDTPKLVLWAHNSHLGDARATDMGQRRGELNIGQLMREHYGMDKVVNIGFTTHTGTVAAADEWDSPVELKQVRQSMPGSYENLFHSIQLPSFALDLRGGSKELKEALEGPLLERAIGVIYRPRTERQSHYFYTQLPGQFDLVIHLDRTSALRPLEATGPWETEWEAREDLPETYPFGV